MVTHVTRRIIIFLHANICQARFIPKVFLFWSEDKTNSCFFKTKNRICIIGVWYPLDLKNITKIQLHSRCQRHHMFIEALSCIGNPTPAGVAPFQATNFFYKHSNPLNFDFVTLSCLSTYDFLLTTNMDVHNKTTRSYNMSRIKGKNTKPELKISRAKCRRKRCQRHHMFIEISIYTKHSTPAGVTLFSLS